MQRITYSFILALSLSACYTAEQDNPLIVGTCMDGIKNQNEKEIDCGGICTECLIIEEPDGTYPITTAPCTASITRNVIIVDGIRNPFTQSSIAYTKPSYDGNFYEYRVSMPYQYYTLYIRLSADQPPTKTRTYTVTESTSSSSPPAGSAYLAVGDSYGYYYSGTNGDKVYLAVENGVTTIDLCSIDMFNYADLAFNITGRIVYAP